MQCCSFKSKLNRFLDGELSPEQGAIVERHVRECAPCRTALERLRAAEGALSHLPDPPDVPQGFAERVLYRAANRGEEPVVRFWRSLTPAMRVAAAAMLALGLSLGLLMGKGNFPGAPIRYDRLHTREEAPERDTIPADVDLFDSLDYFADVPGVSLADAYVRLSSE